MLYQNRTFLPRPFFGIGHKGEDKMLLSNVYVWTKKQGKMTFRCPRNSSFSISTESLWQCVMQSLLRKSKNKLWKNFRKYSEWLVFWNLILSLPANVSIEVYGPNLLWEWHSLISTWARIFETHFEITTRAMLTLVQVELRYSSLSVTEFVAMTQL